MPHKKTKKQVHPIVLNDGEHFRFNLPPSVKKGKHYWFVRCHECDENIHLLEDAHNGESDQQFLGNGVFSAPCQNCRFDGDYNWKSISILGSTKDILIPSDKRPIPSRGSKKPFLPKYSSLRVTFDTQAFDYRPLGAISIASIIAGWSTLESLVSRLMADLIGTDNPAASAVYLTLRQAGSKRDALFAAAEASLASADDLNLVKAVINWKFSAEKKRADIAHGEFGFSFDLEDGLIWRPSSATARQLASKPSDAKFGYFDEREKHFWFVYTFGDLESICEEIKELQTAINGLCAYIEANNEMVKQTWREVLLKFKRVSEEIAKLRE